jgi:penicillin-binding protein 1A
MKQSIQNNHPKRWLDVLRQWSSGFKENLSWLWQTARFKYPWLFWSASMGLSVIFLISFFGGILFLSIMMGAYGQLPDKEDLTVVTNYQASEVLADDGTLLGRYYIENRSNVKYQDISPDFIHALIATEDARFFQHDGVDFRSWFRVLVKNIVLKDRSAGGGSTLSQQLAKNLYPREDYGLGSLLINKLKEVVIASRLEHLYTKEEILELYLNTVPFSENTYGIKVAAHRFFHTTPDCLNPAQSAVLVGMLKATSLYNPMRFPERSVERRNLVLAQMQRYGYLSKKEAINLQKSPLALEYAPLDNNEGPATHFREHLRLELKKKLKDFRKENGMSYNLYTDGLKIYTTLDANMQAYGEKALKGRLKSLQQDFQAHLGEQTPWETDTILLLSKHASERYQMLREGGFSEPEIDTIFNQPIKMTVFDWEKGEKEVHMSPMDSIKYYLAFLNAGFVAMEPQSGKIKAWVGGIEHKYFQYDHVTSRRQVGSTFKPIVYANAIRKGIPPCTYTGNYLRTYWQYEGWRPKNADDKYGGSYSMEGGLIKSINTVTVRMAMRSGPKYVAELAEDLGVADTVPGVPAIALGAVETSLANMIKVYGTFVNRGRRPEPYYIEKVVTRDGEVLIDHSQSADTASWEQVLTPQQADMVREMLRSAVDRGTGIRLRYRYKFQNELGGKTGTSQNHSDGWFMGFTPTLVAGAWVGAESPAVRFRSLRLGQGANTALPIFAEFLQQLNKDSRYDHYTKSTFPKADQATRLALNCPNVVWPEEKAKQDSTSTQEPVIVAAVDEK